MMICVYILPFNLDIRSTEHQKTDRTWSSHEDVLVLCARFVPCGSSRFCSFSGSADQLSRHEVM